MTRAEGCFLRDLWTAACLPLVIGENDTTYVKIPTLENRVIVQNQGVQLSDKRTLSAS